MKKSIYIIIFFLSFAFLVKAQICSMLIFPLQSKHVHSSSIVELPNGDLLTCWFQGSGERTANDVMINGARLKKVETKWREPFLMAVTPRRHDCNPMLFMKRKGKLFPVWIIVQANRWENPCNLFVSNNK